MGNLQQQCRGVTHNYLEVDRREANYLTNEIVSGTVSDLKQANARIQLTGIIYFRKRKRNSLEKCKITFYTIEYNLIPSSSSFNTKQNFQLHLGDHLPPSFNDVNTCPNISYSINLIYNDQIRSSIPVRICPLVHIDRPLLLTPLFFGPVDNDKTGIKLEIKVNRAVFTFGDIVQIYYELQNPNQENIHQIQISLGVYYQIESNVYQEDLCNGMENLNDVSSKNKLIRNKVSLNIPKKLYLPPTFKFQYAREGEQSSFNLTIDYKIQFKVYLDNQENLWQVDIPIVLCNSSLERSDDKTEIISQSIETNIKIVE